MIELGEEEIIELDESGSASEVIKPKKEKIKKEKPEKIKKKIKKEEIREIPEQESEISETEITEEENNIPETDITAEENDIPETEITENESSETGTSEQKKEIPKNFISADGFENENEEQSETVSGKKGNKKKSKRKIKPLFKALIAAGCVIVLALVAYLVVVFGKIPFVVKWRNIWIETAMTTDQHKWLATTFFPDSLIKEIMDAQVDVRDIGQTDIKTEKETDILGQKNLTVGEQDSHGNEVLVNDLEEKIVILKVRTSNFVGWLTLIDDPARVYIADTDYEGSRGEFVCDYLEKENAIVGMNASGFHDPGGVSLGGTVTAQAMSQGNIRGTYSSKYITVGFNKKNELVVGEISDWEKYGLRDAFQYHPALIINGDKVIEGASGWGLQPRTVIGQAENGVVMFLVVDGRQVGYSLGATMGDCADILEEYGAVNAGACDGGSSSVIAYNGEVLNKPSARQMPTGRYLPNAWVVKSKSAEDR